MKLSSADKQKLVPLLNELAGAVEELLLTGLTTATENTRKTLNVSFQEASRMGLLRLGGTLRVANEELARFTNNQTDFSSKRLTFFLNRSWLLTQAMLKALKASDDEQFDKVMRTPSSAPVDKLEVVTLGVAKKATPSFCSFEFRLRTVSDAPNMPVGQRLIWSCVFPVKPGADVPAEAYLHLDQKQKFKPIALLEKNVLQFEKVAVALDGGGGRISLNESSTVTTQDKFEDWQRFLSSNFLEPAIERIRSHKPGPFDLEVEMQEEVVLSEWSLGDAQKPATDHGPTIFPVTTPELAFKATVTPGVEGKDLHGNLMKQKDKKKRDPLFGVMHYDKCALMLQALTVIDEKGPEHLMLSKETFDKRTLLRALSF